MSATKRGGKRKGAGRPTKPPPKRTAKNWHDEFDEQKTRLLVSAVMPALKRAKINDDLLAVVDFLVLWVYAPSAVDAVTPSDDGKTLHLWVDHVSAFSGKVLEHERTIDIDRHIRRILSASNIYPFIGFNRIFTV